MSLPRSIRLPLALTALLLAVVLAYANSLHNTFHFDDFHTVVDNPAIRSLHNVPRFFTDATTFSVLPANRTYRPVVSTTLALDYALAQRFSGNGYALPWYHFGTLLAFLLLVATVFGLYRSLLNASLLNASPLSGAEPASGHPWLALLGAAWFGLHPAMAETVNYVIQRGDLYCTLGCVAALYLYARHPQLRRTGLYLLPYALALLSKPPAAVFPLLLLLYVYFFEQAASPLASRLKKSALAALPSIAVTVALLLLQAAMTPKTFAPTILSPWQYRLTQPYVWLRYSAELFLPVHLNVDTDLQVFSGLSLRAVAGLLFVAALLAAIVVTARRQRLYPIAYGLLWFVITQLPTSLYPLSEVENDHRMFFSFVGLILAAVWAGWLALQRLTTEAQRLQLMPAIVTLCLLCLGGYAYGVHTRNRVWLDEESLWRDDVLKSPQNGRGLMIYGLAQMGIGNYTDALSYFQRALPLTPNYPTLEINLGIVNAALADQALASHATPAAAAAWTLDAERHFERAISLAPQTDEPHAYYGRWLQQHGRLIEARAQLEQAVQLNPLRLLQHDLLIQTCEAEGDDAATRAAAQATLASAPDDSVARMALARPAGSIALTTKASEAQWINLSLQQYRQAQYAASIVSAQNALRFNPRSAEAWNNIGAAHGAMQQWDQAIHDEQQALQLKPDLAIAQNNLRWYAQQKAGAAHPQTAVEYLNDSVRLNAAGNYTDSIAAARKALALQPTMAEAWNNIAAADESLHRWDDAIAAAQKAIALKPDFQLAKNNLAWAASQKAAGIQ